MSDPLQVVPFLAYVAGGVGLWKLVHWLCQESEKILSDDTRDTLALMLLDAKPVHRTEVWLGSWLDLFDRVFTDRHLSLSCFMRSALASFLSVLVLSAVYAAFVASSDTPMTAVTMRVLLIATLFSVVPDYLSLLETRFVLGQARRYKGVGIVVWIAIDLGLTFSLAILTSVLLPLLAVIAVAGDTSIFQVSWVATVVGNAPEMIKALPAAMFFRIPVGVLFWATFLSTAWLLVYGMAVVLVRFARGFEVLRDRLDVVRKPLSTLGFVTGGLAACGWWIVCLVRYLA